MAKSTNSLSTLEILWKALVLPFKNLKLFLPLFLITFLSSSIFFFSILIFILPPLTDLNLKIKELAHTVDRSSPEYAILLAAIKKDITRFLVYESIELLIAFIINSLLTIITLYATLTTYCGELFSFVEILIMAKNNFKGPILTQLVVAFLNSACFVFLILLSIFVHLLVSRIHSINFSILLILIIILVVGLFLYCNFVWSLSIVVSVAEIDCYGPMAIHRSTELIKGRKSQGFLLLLLITAFAFAIYYIAKFSLAHAPNSKEAILVLCAIIFALVAKTLGLFTLAILIVYYSSARRATKTALYIIACLILMFMLMKSYLSFMVHLLL